MKTILTLVLCTVYLTVFSQAENKDNIIYRGESAWVSTVATISRENIDTSYKFYKDSVGEYKIRFIYRTEFCMVPATYPPGQPHYYARISVFHIFKTKTGKVVKYLLGEDFDGQYTINGCFEDDGKYLVETARKLEKEKKLKELPLLTPEQKKRLDTTITINILDSTIVDKMKVYWEGDTSNGMLRNYSKKIDTTKSLESFPNHSELKSSTVTGDWHPGSSGGFVITTSTGTIIPSDYTQSYKKIDTIEAILEVVTDISASFIHGYVIQERGNNWYRIVDYLDNKKNKIEFDNVWSYKLKTWN